jgi:hypothetical protein
MNRKRNVYRILVGKPEEKESTMLSKTEVGG